MASIFSKIVSGEIPCYKIAENDEFLAFLDINPVQKGHTLVIPKQEIDYFFDIDDDMLQRMIIFAKNVARGLKSAIPCNRIALSVVGLEVPHAHIHLVPINHVFDASFERPRVNLSNTEFEALAANIRIHLT